MTAIRLTTDDVARLNAAQRSLLSPHDHADAADWQLAANRAVRRLLGADHSIFSVPGKTVPVMVSDDTDPGFAGRFASYCVGVERGEYRFRDALVERIGRARRAAGTGAYHQHMLGSREAIERSPAYRELFVPAGLTYLVGFSVPLEVGEVTQFFSFEGRDAERRSERGLGMLNLLVPAFEAGVRSHLASVSGLTTPASVLDRVRGAAALFSAAGVAIHRTEALGAMLAREPEAAEVWARVAALASGLAAYRQTARTAPETAVPVEARTRVATPGAEYRLVGSYLDRDGAAPGGVLVLIERLGPDFPSAAELRSRFALTEREAEAALLLAEGLTDGAIAHRLALSPHTARRYSERVLRKLGLHSRAAVAVTLLRVRCGTDEPPSLRMDG